MVVDGDKAYSQEWEQTFKAITNFDIVPGKAGKVLNAYKVELSHFYPLHHLRKRRPVHICSGESIITKL